MGDQSDETALTMVGGNESSGVVIALPGGWTVERLVEEIERAAVVRSPAASLTVAEVVEAVSAQHSSWGRPDVIRAICDVQRPVSQMSGQRWAAAIERAADRVLEHCVDLDPPGMTRRRVSDGRSLWIEPTAPRYSSDAVLVEEERVVTRAIEAQVDQPTPSRTVNRAGLDVLQADAAAAVAGDDRLVLVGGPAGAGKTRMLAAAVSDLHAHHRPVFGVAPTAKAARVLARDTGVDTDTVAKLLHEWQRCDRPPRPEFQPGRGATLVVDEAGMLSTPALHQLIGLAESQRWRLVLVGDQRQLQAVGRGGLFAELCGNGRVDRLERLHRFTHGWEAAASLLLRSGDPRALDAYEAHDRIIPGTLEDHLAHIATTWITHHRNDRALAVVASTNDHVDAINNAIQTARLAAGDLNGDTVTSIAAGGTGEARRSRSVRTSNGEPWLSEHRNDRALTRHQRGRARADRRVSALAAASTRPSRAGRMSRRAGVLGQFRRARRGARSGTVRHSRGSVQPSQTAVGLSRPSSVDDRYRTAGVRAARSTAVGTCAYLARTRVAGDGVGTNVTSVNPASWSQSR